MSVAFTLEESAETGAEVELPVDPSHRMQSW